MVGTRQTRDHIYTGRQTHTHTDRVRNGLIDTEADTEIDSVKNDE